MTPTRSLDAQPREAQSPVLERVCSGGTGHEGQGQKGDAGAWPRGKFSTLIVQSKRGYTYELYFF